MRRQTFSRRSFGPRERALIEASEAEGCPIAFITGAGRATHATSADGEQPARDAGCLALSPRALRKISRCIQELEGSIEDWLSDRAATPAERQRLAAYWHEALPFVDEAGKVDDAAYLAALAAAINSPAPEDAEFPGMPRALAELSDDAAAQLLAMEGARRVPAELAEAMLSAEGLAGDVSLMPGPAPTGALPARAPLLADTLACEPAWLWRELCKKDPSPDPLPPPLWLTAPDAAAARFRKAADDAAGNVLGDPWAPVWAAGAKSWGEAQRKAWGSGRFDAEAARAAADAEAASLAHEWVLRARAGEERRAEEALSRIESAGEGELSRCIAAAMCSALALTLADSARARAPDAAGAARPLLPDRMQMLAGANPVKPLP